MSTGVLEPQPHGGALLRGGGRPPSQASIALREARYELKPSLDKLKAIRDGGTCSACGRPASSADDVVRAILAIVKLSGADRLKPRQHRRTALTVTRATPAEQAAKLASAAAAGSPSPDSPPTP